MITWIVGRGGLLGSGIARALAAAGAPEFVGSPVPWADPAASAATLRSDLARFGESVAGDDWLVVWAAGAAVVASREDQLRDELVLLRSFVEDLAAIGIRGRGAFLLASSAGGVYAGSRRPPFDETTVPRPLSAYGEAKLAAEELCASVLAGSVPVAVGRFSNLYGPGQNLSKRQGLVSELCLGAIGRRPVNVYVPMETLRDYLYVDDAAGLALALGRHAVEQQPEMVVQNVASGHPMSVGGVIRVVQQVARRTIRVGLGADTNTRFQVRDLRIATRGGVWGRLGAPTPFPVGVSRVYELMSLQLRAGRS